MTSRIMNATDAPAAPSTQRREAPLVPRARRDNVSYPHGAADQDERRRLRRHAIAALVNVVLIILFAYLIYYMVSVSWHMVKGSW
jgi:hypothetical protein